MKYEISILLLIVYIIVTGNTYGAFAIKYSGSANACAKEISDVNLLKFKQGSYLPLAFGNYTDSNYSHKFRWCAAHIVGCSLMGAGAVSTLIGLDLLVKGNNSDNFDQTIVGELMFLGGAVAGLVGIPVLIGGAIYDHHKRLKRYSLVAPKRNQIGIAYNF